MGKESHVGQGINQRAKSVHGAPNPQPDEDPHTALAPHGSDATRGHADKQEERAQNDAADLLAK